MVQRLKDHPINQRHFSPKIVKLATAPIIKFKWTRARTFCCQVLLYDPLSSWTLSPERRKALQKAEDLYDVPPSGTAGDCLDGSVMASENLAPEDNVNKMAKRVLLKLKQKLDGIEDGVHLSVSGQVNHLIREAMDPKNLCRLFSGWQPWVWTVLLDAVTKKVFLKEEGVPICGKGKGGESYPALAYRHAQPRLGSPGTNEELVTRWAHIRFFHCENAAV